MRRPGCATSWLQRFIIVALLSASYLTAWSPAKSELMVSVVYPTVITVTPLEHHGRIRLHEAAGTIRFFYRGDIRTLKVPPPAGARFFIPALFIVLMRPFRPYWFYFWLGHFLVSASIIALAWIGLRSVTSSIYGALFVQAYVVDAYSLLVPMLILIDKYFRIYD